MFLYNLEKDQPEIEEAVSLMQKLLVSVGIVILNRFLKQCVIKIKLVSDL